MLIAVCGSTERSESASARLRMRQTKRRCLNGYFFQQKRFSIIILKIAQNIPCIIIIIIATKPILYLRMTENI